MDSKNMNAAAEQKRAMKPLVVLVHGFMNNMGHNTTDRLMPYFEAAGFTGEDRPWQWDYPWKEVVGVWLSDTDNAYGLSRLTKYACSMGRKVVAVGHSNGCLIANRASEDFTKDGGITFPGAHFDRLVLINPALHPLTKFGRAESVTVLYTRWDIVTRIAEYVPVYPWWGDMGAVGYKGSDPRVVNVDTASDRNHPIYSHDAIFEKENLEYWGPQIVAMATEWIDQKQ